MAKRNRWQDETSEKSEQDDDLPEDAPLEAEAEESEPLIDEPPPAEKPVEKLPSIPLKVFIKIAGPKRDQMAGFLSHAKTNKMGPRTVPEWRASYQAFLRKPTR